jgi:hypothetical protein
VSGSSFGLLLQRLPTNDRVLAAAAVVGVRNGSGWFAPQEVQRLFDALRVPRPGNIYRSLDNLRLRNLLRRGATTSEWAVTPLGQEHAHEAVVELNLVEIEVELRGTPGTEFGHALHTVIPPSFAPTKWLAAIARLLGEHPFESNVFLITRFPSGENDEGYLDPLKDVIPAIRLALDCHGLTLHLASDRQLDDDLLGNVAAHMWACQFAIGILENRMGRGLNYNAITEIGAMLMTGRRCAILKDSTVPSLPSDIGGQIYKPLDLAETDQVVAAVHGWAANDLGLGTCKWCPQ